MIPFLDIHKINAPYKTAFQQKFEAVLDKGHFVLGKEVAAFENAFAAYCGTKHTIGAANGLDALTLILKGYMHLGVLQKGDKILVPANTFIATILSVLHANLTPVLVEPNPNTFNIDVEAAKTKIDNDVKAIIMVHLYGQLADVEALQQLCKTNNLLLIEDAAQAHGAELKIQDSKLKIQSLIAGNLADAAAFSFYPAKNLGALGDGGAITTNNSQLFKAVKQLRNYGSTKKYMHNMVGFNSRLDELQAAFLSIKLNHLDTQNQNRRQIANAYLQGINNPKIKLPFYDGSKNHVFHLFVVQVKNRGHFTDYLTQNNVGWLVHYPIPPHQQKALSQFSNLNLPITEQLSKCVVSLPMSPVITNNEVNTVISILNQY